MRVILSVLTGVAVLVTVPALSAQQKTPAPRRESPPSRIMDGDRDGCVTTGGKTECRIVRRGPDSALMKRAAIGVQLGATGSVRDTLGVFVTRVTPKGPAENAGIVEGDRIVSINGVDLRVNAADAGDSYAAQLPSRRLTREVAKMTPGSTLNLRVYSAGRVRDVAVTAGRASDVHEPGSFGLLMDGMPGRVMLRSGPSLDNMRMHLDGMSHMMNPSEMRITRDGDNRITIEREQKIEKEKKETKKK